MKKIALKLLITLCVLVASHASGEETASTAQTSASTATVAEGPPEMRGRVWTFLGVGLGYSTLRTDIIGEENKSGMGADVKALLSYYWDDWVVDGGIGIDYKRISGVRPDGFKATLETRSLYLEVDGRRRFSEHWQGGLFLQGHYGNDLSHRPTIDPILAGEAGQNLIFMGGLQGVYETISGTTPIRFIGRVGTDLDIDNRQLYAFQLLFQVGFPLTKNEIPVAVIETERVPAVREIPDYYDIPLYTVLFETDSAALEASAMQVIERLGDHLVKNQGAYSRIEILGHADKQGGYIYNIALSQQRADSVVGVLETRGVASAIVLAKAYGYTKPIVESPVLDQPRNRRAVIRLYGVRENQEFLEELKRIVSANPQP